MANDPFEPPTPACARCNSATAEFFGVNGDKLCRVCYYAEDTQLREQWAADAVEKEVPEALRGAVQLQDQTPKRNEAPKPPGTLLRQGITLMLVGCILTVVAFVIEAGVLFALGAIGLGFVLTVRGYKLRHYM